MQERTPITPEDTAETLHDRLADMGSRLVVSTLRGLAEGSLQGRPQEVSDQLRPAPKIFKADCAINWNLPGKKIVDFVRGLSPYPAATMQMIDDKGNTQQFKVYEVAFEEAPNTEVGALTSDQKNYQKVSVSDGYIHILSLQMSGKRRITIQEFLRGYNTNDWKLAF